MTSRGWRTIEIDGQAVPARPEQTVWQAANAVGIYIPAVCSHPALTPTQELSSVEAVFRGEERLEGLPGLEYPGCGLCLVEVEGLGEVRACQTAISEGMVVHTTSDKLKEARQKNLGKILANHPHACLVCPQAEGCDRLRCSMNVPPEERCCELFGRCELQKVAEYIGIPEGIPRYVHPGIPVLDDEPMYLRDYNLCIGCTRCVRVCNKIQGGGILGFVVLDDLVKVGSSASTLMDSGCKFCTACVAVCPTGALRDKDPQKGRMRREKLKLEFSRVLPPQPWLELEETQVAAVPEAEGVYQLYDERHGVLQIKGVPNLRLALREHLREPGKACYFSYELEQMYTQRESELLQQYLQQHGRLPGGELDELEELF